MNKASWRVTRLLVGYPGYLHKVRGALLAMSIMVVTLAGLAAAATPGVATFRHQREVSLTPSTSPAADASFRFGQTGSDRLWGGHRVTRVFVARAGAGHPEPAHPPGLAAFPAPGQAYVSPHLLSLIRSDPLARNLLGESQVAGVIGSAGLTAPGEDRAVIGMPVSDGERLTPADGWGGAPVSPPSEARVMIVLGIFLGLLVLAPAIALALITARLGENERGDRAAILRMLGAPRSAAAQVSVIEAAVVGLPAAAAAIAVFDRVVSRGPRIPVVDLSLFPRSAELDWPVQLVVGLLAVGLHCGIAAGVSARGRPGLQPLLATTPLRLRSLWLLLVGLVVLAALAFVTSLPAAVAGLAFFGGVAALALSLATALPTATRWLAGRAAARARRGGTLFGLRLLAERSLPSSRIAGVIALLVVALGAAIPFLAILNGGSVRVSTSTRRGTLGRS